MNPFPSESSTSCDALPVALRQPLTADSFIGQDEALRQVQKAAANAQRPHFIFVGESGIGKTTLARYAAKLLGCTAMIDSVPCNACAICRAIDIRGYHRAYHERNAAGRDGSKEEVNELLENDIRSLPPGYRKHIVFYDESQQLSTYAQDALLKVLEDETKHVVFIFALTNANHLSEAFQARCRVIRLRAPTAQERLSYLHRICLRESISADEDALNLVAEQARNFRRASTWLRQLRDVAGEAGRVTADLTRRTLFESQSGGVVRFLIAAFDGDLPAVLDAGCASVGKGTLSFKSVQRVLLHLKKFVIGPKIVPVARLDTLLYDAAELKALEERVERHARIVGKPAGEYLDDLLEHWINVPPETSEAFQAFAIKFVDVCAAAAASQDSVAAISAVPRCDEPYRSKGAFQARVRSPGVSGSQDADRLFLTTAQAREAYEATTFLTQVYGVTFNATFTIDFGKVRNGQEKVAAWLLTSVGRELGQRFRAWGAAAGGSTGVHRLTLLDRAPDQSVIGTMIFHSPASHELEARDWLAKWLQRAVQERGLPPQDALIDIRVATDPRNAIDRQWRLLRRHIWSSLNPKAYIEQAALIDRLGVLERDRRMLGQIKGSRLHKSNSIGPKARDEMNLVGMGHVSAWRSNRWDQLTSGWELREHRQRAIVRDAREERQAILNERRSLTCDPLTLAVIDHLEREQWAHCLVDPIERQRAEPLWPAAEI